MRDVPPRIGQPAARAAGRLPVLLIAVAAAACDASTPSEVSENLDVEGAGAVAFSDAQLEAVVRQVLGLGDAVVTEAALEALTGLGAPETGITSLDGLEYAANLEELILPGNAVRDLRPLTGLTGLRRLDLTGNGLTDTDAAHLAEMHALEVLMLDANELEDLGMLQTLENLQVLSLAGNRISGFGPLSELSALRVVDLSRNRIDDLAGLEGPAAPIGLLLEDNEITDLGPLLGHDGLRDQAAHLDLAGNPLSEESRCDYAPALRDAGLTIRGAAPCPGAPEGEAMFITTDRSVYVSEHHHISATFSHLGAGVLHGNKCSDGPEWEWQFQIEKLVDGDWAVVHEPVRLLCLNPQQVHLGDEVRFVPFSIGMSTGTYRLTWPWIFEDSGEAKAPPLEQRVSTQFSVVGP